MKRYFIKFYNDFSNTYNLAWAETPEQMEIAKNEGWSQISRVKAINFCKKEREKEHYNSMFSGYASRYIYPIDIDIMEINYPLKNYSVKNYIVSLNG